MNKSLGIVLSGGGTRGMAHIGLLQALKENGIQPDYIAGASAGALVGAMYAAGCTPEQSLELFTNTPLFSWTNYNLTRWKPGLFDTEKYRKYFLRFLPDDSFEALQTPLFVSVTDVCTGRPVLMNSGPIIRVLSASAAVPPVFSPVLIDGTYYADGGIMNNFPIEPLEERCTHILGSYASPVRHVEAKEMWNSFNLVGRSYELVTHAQSYVKFKRCHYLFSPDELYPFGLLNTSKLETVYQVGYEKALEQIPQIKKALGLANDQLMAS